MKYFLQFSGILETKKDLCENQNVNFVELFNNVLKCRAILKKEKMWNTFKNLDIKGQGFLSLEQVVVAFRELGLKVKNIEINFFRLTMKELGKL